ncbi:LysR family transcriptional regulator [Sphingomonas sp. MM-1]|nr:LysR family transcriptional regulator [Sphingomonas sp. MM-1]
MCIYAHDSPSRACQTGPMLDWDNLRIFLTAVRAGNYTAAARRLRIDRTTVGRRLDRLERQLGVPLFEQGEDGYHPTVAGRRVLEIADRMEELADSLAEEIGGRARAPAGHVRVIIAADLGAELMPDLAAFAAAHPDIRLSIQSSADPCEDVIQRKSDIGLCLVDQQPDHLRGRRVGTLRQAPYAAAAYTDREKPADPGAVAHWICCAGRPPLPAMRRWDGAIADRAAVAAYVDSWAALRGAVDQGLGAAFLWTFAADPAPGLRRIAPPDPAIGIDLWLLVRDDVPMEQATRAFLHDMADRLSRRIAPAD